MMRILCVVLGAEPPQSLTVMFKELFPFPAVYHAVHIPLVVTSGIRQFFFIFCLVFHHGLLFSHFFSLNPERVIKGQVPEATLCPPHAPLWASPSFPVK